MNLLNHVAIIMDGNGRWGLKHKNSRNAGHKAGLNTVESIIKQSIKNKIKYLTLFAFSTENWKRPKKEVNYLFNLLEDFLTDKIDDLHKQNIKLKIIGSKNFSKKLNLLLNLAEKKTSKNSKIQINLALNYGAKFELISAIKKLQKNKDKINEKNIEKFLYTKNIPDPDLMIRTGNTKRLSNFLLWQLAYSEIFFEKKMWPDFNDKDFQKIIKEYKNLKRNFGKI
ncbi:polyprenyl diphosphate synthase [Candidatus Pelagibacter sp.]|nr:polyprenyl diphosphate synthase [Candidatus Pelagibacter sp.]MDA9890076.1 polyprenyl diphosphate synthase [Candidatus Pelagibacter sp.]